MLRYILQKQIKTNAIFTFDFETPIYQYLMGVTCFSLKLSSPLSLRQLSISLCEVARTPTSVTIQPILRMRGGDCLNTGASYVTVTMVATDEANASVQLNSAVSVPNGKTASFSVNSTSEVVTRLPVIASGFYFECNSTTEVGSVSFSTTLDSDTSSEQQTKVNASMTGSSTQTADVGIILGFKDGQSDNVINGFTTSRLQDASTSILAYGSYDNNVAFIQDYKVSAPAYFSSYIEGEVSISGSTVYGKASYQVEHSEKSYDQDDSKSGICITVLQWNDGDSQT